jgi:hypothetical protein
LDIGLQANEVSVFPWPVTPEAEGSSPFHPARKHQGSAVWPDPFLLAEVKLEVKSGYGSLLGKAKTVIR